MEVDFHLDGWINPQVDWIRNTVPIPTKYFRICREKECENSWSFIYVNTCCYSWSDVSMRL